MHPNPKDDVEYSHSHVLLMARYINEINNKVTRKGASFGQQYMLHKGLKEFGDKGRDAAMKELDQLHK